MKITKINVEVKKSWNYQTYTVGMEVQVEEGDNVDNLRDAIMKKCKTQVMQQIVEEKTLKK